MLGLATIPHAVPILKTIASQKEGIEALAAAIQSNKDTKNEKRSWLLAEKAYYLIQKKRMSAITKSELKEKIELAGNAFNMYRFIKDY
jgi:LAO/AO transport system kinase